MVTASYAIAGGFAVFVVLTVVSLLSGPKQSKAVREDWFERRMEHRTR